jgi:hypothetical protein
MNRNIDSGFFPLGSANEEKSFFNHRWTQINADVRGDDCGLREGIHSLAIDPYDSTLNVLSYPRPSVSICGSTLLFFLS